MPDRTLRRRADPDVVARPARRADRTAALGVGGLVLNSPFFDLHGPSILRAAPTSAALRALARLRKTRVIRKPTEGGYGATLHRDHHGEFDYNLDWKPLGGFPSRSAGSMRCGAGTPACTAGWTWVCPT